MKRIVAVIALMVAAMFSPASAQQPSRSERSRLDVRTFSCPVGGQSFEQELGYSSFPLITMPDGSWLGDTEIGVQIPVCPGNGLVLIPDLARSAKDGDNKILYAIYSTKEQERLPALIRDPAYLALKGDGPYAQAWWLATQLGRPVEDRFFMLQRSTWATRDPALRKRLVARFAAEAPALVAELRVSEDQKHMASLYIVNALRELGHFDEALALLNRIDGKSEPTPPSDSPYGGNGPQTDTDKMRLAIAEKDDGRFAAELLPDRMVNDICGNELAIAYGPTTPATLAACKVRRAREAQSSAEFDGALALLRADKSGVDQACAATPKDKRPAALNRACAIRQDDLDQLAANALSADGPKLAAACEDSSRDVRNNMMRHACINYDIALGQALGEQLGNDDAAYAMLCPVGLGGEDGEDAAGDAEHDRNSMMSSACASARWAQKQHGEERLLADSVALAPRCANTHEEAERDIGGYEVLLSACSTLERNRKTAEIAHLASDLAAFGARCARFAKTNSAGNEVNVDLEGDADICRSAWRLRENTRTKIQAEAKGLRCFGDVVYSPERPECVTPADYARRMAPAPASEPKPNDMGWMDKGTSLMTEVEARAAAIIAAAKAGKKGAGAKTVP